MRINHARRAKIKELAMKGLTPAQVARALKLKKPSLIYEYYARMPELPRNRRLHKINGVPTYITLGFALGKGFHPDEIGPLFSLAPILLRDRMAFPNPKKKYT